RRFGRGFLPARSSTGTATAGAGIPRRCTPGRSGGTTRPRPPTAGPPLGRSCLRARSLDRLDEQVFAFVVVELHDAGWPIYGFQAPTAVDASDPGPACG